MSPRTIHVVYRIHLCSAWQGGLFAFERCSAAAGAALGWQGGGNGKRTKPNVRCAVLTTTTDHLCKTCLPKLAWCDCLWELPSNATKLTASMDSQHAAEPLVDPHRQADLPILEHQQEIIDALQTSQVVIVVGETGSGTWGCLRKMLEAHASQRPRILQVKPPSFHSICLMLATLTPLGTVVLLV